MSTTALSAAESALAQVIERADAALAVMRQEAQDAAARYRAARLEVARIKAERQSVEQSMAEAAAGFEQLAAELSDAFPAPAQTPEEPVELTEDVVVTDGGGPAARRWPCASSHRGCRGTVVSPATLCDRCEEVTSAANGPAAAAGGRGKGKKR